MKRWIYIVFLFLATACSTYAPEIEVVVHECATPIEGRAVTMCFEENSTLYFVGGRLQDGTYPSYMLCYNALTDQWSKSDDIPLRPRVNGTACATTQGVFLGLGYNGGHVDTDTAYQRDWWLFEPQLNRWTQKADFPTDQTVAAVSWTDNRYVWVDFGFRGFNNNLWRYEIATDTWSKQDQSGSLPDRLMSPVAAQCGNRYFAGTGFRRVSRSGWWEWFSAKGNMPISSRLSKPLKDVRDESKDPLPQLSIKRISPPIDLNDSSPPKFATFLIPHPIIKDPPILSNKSKPEKLFNKGKQLYP